MTKKNNTFEIQTWRPFKLSEYRFSWIDKGFRGIFKQLKNDIKYSFQRITKGYCDYDLFSIDYWFMDIMPRMLTQFKETRHGSPCSLENTDFADNFNANNTCDCHKEWDNILDKMIFLIRECNEDTCMKKNPYEKEHNKISDEFIDKYGVLGEKLMTDKEKEDAAITGGGTVHFSSEIPEYKDTEDKYYEEERNLVQYRMEKKDEFFKLFSLWFFDLWD